MARAHVEFIQAQAVPWTQGYPGGQRDDVESKVLSYDPDNGAATAILRYPAGWRRDRPEVFGCDEEFFVLDGALTINGQRYHPHSYGYFPAGYPRQGAISEAGAVLLTFFEGPAETAKPGQGFRIDGGLVPFIDTLSMPWAPVTHDPKVPVGLMTKTLRIDPDTKERTWMNARLPGGVRDGFLGAQEYHPVVEEVFLLAGDLFLERGVLQAGGYFWRPPPIKHGPFGTRAGLMMIARTKGGPLVNHWTEEKYPFTFTPPHKVDLPPELQAYGAKPYACMTVY